MVPIACPKCQLHLTNENVCPRCGESYRVNQFGFLDLSLGTDYETGAEELVENQETCGTRMYEEYLYPRVEQAGAKRILDAGCGTGGGVSMLVEKHGLDAYGIDLPFESRFWQRYGRDPKRFFAANATTLPFASNEFDFVISTGVIEHIGTANGHEDLAQEFTAHRKKYVDELIRVTRPGGQIIIGCPNKSFPVDLQHNPQRPTGLRALIHRRTGIHLHPTWGRYHLVSYGEMHRLLDPYKYEPLPLRGYFGFTAFNKPALKPLLGLAEAYINHLPAALRSTPLNPYMLVIVTK